MPKHTNRRTFLQLSLASGAALAVPALARSADASPNNKIVVGVMGTGGRGTALAKTFQQQSGVDVAYVCDVDRKRVDKAAAEVGKISGKAPKTVTDFRRILEDK